MVSFPQHRGWRLTECRLAAAFKEVGCSIKELSKTQSAAMKMTKAEASQHKRAVLKIPLEFPPPPRKRTVAGGRR